MSFVRRNFAFCISLLLAAAATSAGTAVGQFNVKVTLNPSSSTSNGNICTSASGSGVSSSSVQVQCTTNVFVNIARVKATETGQFITSFRPARDSLFPDFCRNEQIAFAGQPEPIACRIDDLPGQIADADVEEGGGWSIEGRLYAVNANATSGQAQTLARLKLGNNQGTLTALRVDHADGRSGAVEMLVSF
jgi:hypothetical protein